MKRKKKEYERRTRLGAITVAHIRLRIVDIYPTQHKASGEWCIAFLAKGTTDEEVTGPLKIWAPDGTLYMESPEICTLPRDANITLEQTIHNGTLELPDGSVIPAVRGDL